MNNADNIFIGIPVPENLLFEIDNLYNDLEFVKWASSANLHLTLRFLGKLSEQELVAVQGAVKELKFSPIELKQDGITLWKPNLLVITTMVTESLSLVKKQIDQLLAGKLSLQPEERVFKPHITIARIKTSKLNKTILTKFFKQIKNAKLPNFTAKEIFLYKAITSSQGKREYVKLARVPAKMPKN